MGISGAYLFHAGELASTSVRRGLCTKKRTDPGEIRHFFGFLIYLIYQQTSVKVGF